MTTRLLPINGETDLVTFTIEVEGEPLPQHIRVYSIEVILEANRIPTASIYMADGDPAAGEWTLSSDEYFVPGKKLVILAGYHSEEEEVFSGIVVSQALRVRERRLELQVLCKHEAVAMTTTRRSRHFVDMTDADAVSQILGDYGITAGEIASTTTTHTDLVQYDATDWDFVVMRMEANGLVCTADADGFQATAPSVDDDPVATLQFGANVIEFDGEIDARRQYGAVTAQAWDFAAQDVATTDASDPAWTTPGNLAPADLAGAVGAESYVVRHAGGIGSDELQSWSDAVLLRSRMAFARGRARVQGFAAAKPAAVVELAGFGDRFNGNVWIGAVRHEIGRGNWMTDLELGMPEEWHARRFGMQAAGGQELLPSVSGLHTGIVTALEGDPAGEARIRVKVPSIDLEGDGIWARVSTLDAGASRGTVILPEIDDEVVVAFFNDDPRHPVVLGMLHSSAHAPPQEASDDNHIKGYVSRSGMRIMFDDEKTILTFETPAGHIVTMDDDAGTLVLQDSNGNKIELSSSGITLTSAGDLVLTASGNVKAEGQTNVELKAGAQCKAEGSAGLEVSSSAVTVVKGSLVQIN